MNGRKARDVDNGLNGSIEKGRITSRNTQTKSQFPFHFTFEPKRSLVSTRLSVWHFSIVHLFTQSIPLCDSTLRVHVEFGLQGHFLDRRL